MPRLIVLNGPPGSGKSTLARRFVDEHPMTLNLEIDGLRRMLGGWKTDPHAAGERARELALALVANHLEAGYDVVVPQYLGRVDYLARLADVARTTGADLHEFVLLDTKDVLIARFAARTAAAREPAHLDAQEILDRVGGTKQLEAMYDRLLLVIGARAHAQVVPAREGEIEATYREFRRRLDQ
ncbi:MAG: AAA family ATPase [Jatrophihabitans sp.]